MQPPYALSLYTGYYQNFISILYEKHYSIVLLGAHHITWQHKLGIQEERHSPEIQAVNLGQQGFTNMHFHS